MHMYIHHVLLQKNSTEVTYVYEPSVHTNHVDESVHNKNIDEDEAHTGPPREFEGPGARYGDGAWGKIWRWGLLLSVV